MTVREFTKRLQRLDQDLELELVLRHKWDSVKLDWSYITEDDEAATIDFVIDEPLDFNPLKNETTS